MALPALAPYFAQAPKRRDPDLRPHLRLAGGAAARRAEAVQFAIARGQAAERAAIRLYERAKFEILEIDYHHGHYQIDFIAKRDDVVHFVEVKYRKTLMDAHYALKPDQLSRIAISAREYMREMPGQCIQIDAMLFDHKMNWQRLDNIATSMHFNR